MEKLLIILALAVSSFMQSQVNYEQGMDQALQLWEEGKITESSAIFERIASAEKDNWLPNYYLALVNTTSAFQVKDQKKREEMLQKAQTALDVELLKQPENAELLVLQALIHTVRIAADPMTKGPELSGAVAQLYNKAEAIAPENPRVVFEKAQFQMGTTRFFGNDTAPISAEIEKSLKLFDNFKAESKFYPNWGKEQAIEAHKACK